MILVFLFLAWSTINRYRSNWTDIFHKISQPGDETLDDLLISLENPEHFVVYCCVHRRIIWHIQWFSNVVGKCLEPKCKRNYRYNQHSQTQIQQTFFFCLKTDTMRMKRLSQPAKIQKNDNNAVRLLSIMTSSGYESFAFSDIFDFQSTVSLT